MPGTPVRPDPSTYVAPPPLQIPKPGSEQPMQAPETGVTIRMYRQGLGDCFLLAFPTGNPQKPYYVLIDCGLFQKVQNQTQNLTAVATDIQMATQGEIDLLVITHRHADHISGFRLAKGVFSQMKVHNLWLSWAENPLDDTACQLWTKTTQAAAALTALAAENPMALDQTSRLQGFDEPAAAPDDPFAVLQFVRSLLAPGGVTAYYKGGDGPLALPPAPGVATPAGARIYVLGPPTSLAALAQMNPNPGNPDETYLAAAPNAVNAFLMGKVDTKKLIGEARAMADLSFPFDWTLRISHDDAQRWPGGFFNEHYGFAPKKRPVRAGEAPPQPVVPPLGAGLREPDADMPDDDSGRGSDWRRVDDDWLAAGEALALQLDNCVNNTTLVLAVELIKSRKVLMLVGDAQVGNWLSWHDLKPWDLPEEKRQVTVSDLLSRTVLYKVGHHGSSNATIVQLQERGSQWGFGLMQNPELVAMLPVDENFAKNFQGWQFPDDELWQALEQRTNMRVLRLDRDHPDAPPIADAAWQDFVGRQVVSTPLYIQYTLTE